MELHRRIRVAALFVLMTGGLLGAGQNPAPAAPQTPTFKVRVDYVEVDAVVTDRDGNFVRDLKQEDFQLFEDGKPETISAFAIVDLPVERYQRPLYASQPIEPDVKTNERPFDGRVYVMVIDDLHTNYARTQRTRAAARKFIQEHLGANDLMAVVHTVGPSDASQELTNNTRLLLAAVDKTSGRKLQSPALSRRQEFVNTLEVRPARDPVRDSEEIERIDNARRSLAQLKDTAEWFAGVRGRRKTILFFSEGIDYDISQVLGRSTSAPDTGTGAALLFDGVRDTIGAATRGNVIIYGIDSRGLTQPTDEAIETSAGSQASTIGIGQRSMQADMRLSQQSLRELSEETGGFAAVNSNDFSTAFDRIVRDNSAYYLLAYYPPTGQPGKVRTIEVRVSRPGLTVRARRVYVTPRPARLAPRNARTVETRVQRLITPGIREAIESPLPVSGLTIHAFAAPFKGVSPAASVLVGVEIHGRDLRLNANDKVTMSYVAITSQGTIRSGNTVTVTLNLPPERKELVEQTGLRLLDRLNVPPGRYQFRIAAHDSGGGRVGAVLYDLEVPDFTRGALSMSGIVLTSAAGSIEPTLRPDQQLTEVLPAQPIAMRRFPRDDEITLFVEVYDNQPSKPHKVDITATVTTDEGTVMFRNDEVRDWADLRGKRGGHGYTTRIPLKDLAAGSYVLTVSARSTLGHDLTAERQLQFTIGER